MKDDAEKEFTATIQSINLNKEQIDTISQKASERIEQMKQRKRERLKHRAISQEVVHIDNMSAISGYNQASREETDLSPKTPLSQTQLPKPIGNTNGMQL